MFSNIVRVVDRSAIRRWIVVGASLVLLLPSVLLAAAPDYHRAIRPMLRERCVGCHNPNRKAGELDLSSYASIMAGSASGKVVERGLPEDSLLYLVVTHEEEPAMPPEGDRLSDESLAILSTWIEFGMPENAAAAKTAVSLRPKSKPMTTVEVLPPSEEMTVGEPGESGSARFVFQSERANAITGLAVSKDLVARSAQNQIVLFDAAGFVDVLAFPEGDVFDLHFSSDGQRLFAAGGTHAASGKVVLWDIATRERIAEYGDEFDTVLASDATPDGSTLVFGGAERLIKVVDAEAGLLLHKLDKHTDWVFDIAINPDGLVFASADRAGNLFVWETASGQHIHTLRGHRGAVTEIDWLHGEDAFVTVGEDGTVRVWDAHQGQQMAFWKASDSGLLGVSVSPDDTIHTIARSGELASWDQDGNKLPLQHRVEIMPTEVEALQGEVVIGTWSGDLKLLNKQGDVSSFAVPDDQTSDVLASLSMEPRRANGFRQFEAATIQSQVVSYVPNTKAPGMGSAEADDSWATITPVPASRMDLSESAASYFRKRELKLVEEAESFSKLVAELKKVQDVISNLEARYGRNQEVLRSLVAGLERHRQQAAQAQLADVELLIRIAEERAQAKLQQPEVDRQPSSEDVRVVKNCQQTIDRIDEKVRARLAKPGSEAELWQQLGDQLAAARSRLDQLKLP